MLRTTVLVRRVTNLSDARYCAGMGVELLGFPLTGSDALTAAAVNEIGGWVSGIQRVGEFDNSLSAAEINALISACALDYVLLTEPDVHLAPDELARPIIWLLDADQLRTAPANAAFIVLTGLTDLADTTLLELLTSPSYPPVLLALTDETSATEAAEVLAALPALAGLALEGGQELRPGIRDFGALADILEALETD